MGYVNAPAAALRARWAAIGAAVAVSIGAGGIAFVDATVSSGERGIYVPITPCRLFDTRQGDQVGPRGTPLGPGETYTQPVRGSNGNCSIPADAIGVALNATVVNGSAPSYLTLWPSDVGRPLASSLNWVAGAPPTPNKVDVDLGADGAIKLYNFAGTVDVLADAVGYYADHDHDDRYYPKPDSDARYAPSSVVVSFGVSSWLTPNEMDQGSTLNGCAWAPISNNLDLPLQVPVGSVLRAVEITMLDAVGLTEFNITLVRVITGTSSNSSSVVDSATGGTLPSVALKTVVRRLEPNVTIAAGEAYRVHVSGLASAAGNAICGANIEYDTAP